MAPPVKAIVFSQWTGMLDLLELSLNRNGIQFRRLDGAMSLDLREKEVNGFKTDRESNAYVTEGWQSGSKHGSCLPCDHA
ncbi:Putative SNF2-domain/RING finger domain/helicase domain protein [Zea mays]|uniref:Putative SNF2-domain/RING finger domain/helicase domain protein n=1 Tax=Zea mays TaxID=4577 RepID=A0A1D6JF35_MAIZE|nr:Putative SNF2-domain/RING finger domain/helicase domain protein [Zea mays]